MNGISTALVLLLEEYKKKNVFKAKALYFLQISTMQDKNKRMLVQVVHMHQLV